MTDGAGTSEPIAPCTPLITRNDSQTIKSCLTAESAGKTNVTTLTAYLGLSYTSEWCGQWYPFSRGQLGPNKSHSRYALSLCSGKLLPDWMVWLILHFLHHPYSGTDPGEIRPSRLSLPKSRQFYQLSADFSRFSSKNSFPNFPLPGPQYVLPGPATASSTQSGLIHTAAPIELTQTGMFGLGTS